MEQHFAKQNDDNLSYFFGSAWMKERAPWIGLRTRSMKQLSQHILMHEYFVIWFFFSYAIDWIVFDALIWQANKAKLTLFFSSCHCSWGIRWIEQRNMANWKIEIEHHQMASNQQIFPYILQASIRSLQNNVRIIIVRKTFDSSYIFRCRTLIYLKKVKVWLL